MNNTVTRRGTLACKRLGPDAPKSGQQLERLSIQLADAGVPTPVAQFAGEYGEIRFPWIAGHNGKTLVLGLLDRHQGDWHALPDRLFMRMLLPLVKLHQFKQRSLDLQPFDPWLRIRPRLARFETAAPSLPDTLLELQRSLQSLLNRWRDDHPEADTVPVHGDFHIGQLLFDDESEHVWLIDLDDMALGQPESDLGNCAAHLATLNADSTDSLVYQFRYLSEHLRQRYSDAGGTQLSPQGLVIFGAIALLRRALKFHELGAGSERVKAILGAIKQLTGAQFQPAQSSG